MYTNYIASAYGHTSYDYDSAGNSVTLKFTKRDTVSNIYATLFCIFMPTDTRLMTMILQETQPYCTEGDTVSNVYYFILNLHYQLTCLTDMSLNSLLQPVHVYAICLLGKHKST